MLLEWKTTIIDNILLIIYFICLSVILKLCFPSSHQAKTKVRNITDMRLMRLTFEKTYKTEHN